jgi:hypothetical protein
MAVRRRAARERFSISVDASKRGGSACLYPDPFSAAVEHRMVLTLFVFAAKWKARKAGYAAAASHDSH